VIHRVLVRTINVIGYLFLIGWPAYLVAAAMAFDAPGSDKQIGPWVIVTYVALLPFLVIGLPFVANKQLGKGRIFSAYAISVFPISPILLLFSVGLFH
jgi:hypothetical protein